jgi:guanylate kinase
VLARRPEIVLSVSATTRKPRRGEIDGVHYHFLSDAQFDELVTSGGFLEYADVHGARYGTLREPVEQALSAGKTVLLEIDVQGSRAIKRAIPAALLIFIEPPSRDVLRKRLHQRKTESDESFSLRMANAVEELDAAAEFDHRVVNQDLDRAITEVLSLLDQAI